MHSKDSLDERVLKHLIEITSVSVFTDRSERPGMQALAASRMLNQPVAQLAQDAILASDSTVQHAE